MCGCVPVVVFQNEMKGKHAGCTMGILWERKIMIKVGMSQEKSQETKNAFDCTN